jgi:hypothetical protein
MKIMLIIFKSIYNGFDATASEALTRIRHSGNKVPYFI